MNYSTLPLPKTEQHLIDFNKVYLFFLSFWKEDNCHRHKISKIFKRKICQHTKNRKILLSFFAIKFSWNFIIKKRINFDILSLINFYKNILYIFVFKCSLCCLYVKLNFDFPPEFHQEHKGIFFSLTHVVWQEKLPQYDEQSP